METFLYNSINNFDNFNLLMAYPEKEEFAMSSLGYLWLYRIADMNEGVNVKRFFTDSSQIPDIRKYGAVSFSLSFDFDFMGVLKVLESLNIPFYSKDRANDDVLVFAGGIAITTNPIVLSDFFDFLMIGDGEKSFQKVLNVLKENISRFEKLKKLSKIEGIYVPSLKNTIVRCVESLENVIYTPIISDKSYFKDTFIIELSRGCMNRCAFCTASYLNLPFRYYDYKKITEVIDLGLKYTNKIALLGAQVSAHPYFKDIIRYIDSKINDGNNINASISSLRTDSVTEELVKFLVKCGQKTSTIAIEAASERLRKLINKNLKEEQIFEAIRISRENGLKGLKIYSMIGIPTENDCDIKEFINLAERIKKENKGFELTFSFSTFVPKPNTPFQWVKREDTRSLEKKQKYLERELSRIGVKTKFTSVKWDYWQTVLSRADNEISKYLVEIYKSGGKLTSYKSILKEYLQKHANIVDGFSIGENLAWNIFDNSGQKIHLLDEYNRLFSKI